MSPESAMEKVWKFQTMVGSTRRVGVSELAKTKAWRNELKEDGCFEVVDRGGLVGYMLSPDCATAMSERIDQLEMRLEQLQIEAMFKTRKCCSNAKTAPSLSVGAIEYFDKSIDDMLELINGR